MDTAESAPAVDVPEVGPEEGLAKNSVSLPGALFVAVATMAPGAGAAFAIVAGAPYAGGALPASVIVALIGCLLVAVAVGQLAKHIPSAGGLSSYIAEGVHSGAGFVAAWAYPAVYLAAVSYLGLVFGNLLATSVTSGVGTAYDVVWVLGAVLCVGGAAAMNFFGIRFGTRAGMILGVFEIAVLVVMSVWMIVKAGNRNTIDVVGTHYAQVKGFSGSSGIIAGSIYGFLAFVGFEAAAPLGEEARHPKKTIPRAVFGSALLVGVFFFFTTYASDVFYGPSKMAGFLAYGQGDPWIALSKVIWGGGWVILLIALLNSSLACANAAGIAATRTMWSMGRIKTMPSAFARTHKRWKSPTTAIAVMFGGGLVVAIWLGFQYSTVTAYSLMGTILTIVILPIYFVAALACPLYYFRYRRNELNWFLHVICPLLGMAFLVPAFVTGAGIKLFSFVSPLSYPLNLAGPIVAAWYVLGIGLMIWLMVRHPERIAKTATIFVDDEPDDVTALPEWTDGDGSGVFPVRPAVLEESGAEF
jgi:amino acid transporter